MAGELDDQHIIKLISLLLKKKEDIDQITELLWQWKTKKEEEAKFYKNMYNDLLEGCNRLDNEKVNKGVK